MCVKHIALLASLAGVAFAIYPYFDTQDFIYNVPKVFRISITLDRLLEYYEKKPSKDPEWHVALGMARGNNENDYIFLGFGIRRGSSIGKQSEIETILLLEFIQKLKVCGVIFFALGFFLVA